MHESLDNEIQLRKLSSNKLPSKTYKMGADTPHEDYFASKLSVASYAQRQRAKNSQKFILMYQAQPLSSSRRPAPSVKNYQRDAMRSVGLPIQVFHRSELQAGDQPRLQIENFRLLASYNWTGSVGPTIIVPGMWNLPSWVADVLTSYRRASNMG